MFTLLGFVLLLAGVVFLVYGCRLYHQPRVGDQISLWRGTLALPGEPSGRFYQRLYQAFKASLQDRLGEGDDMPIEVVLTGMGFGPHRLFAAPSLLASRPLYLLVRYRHLRCYIYAGPTPTGLFVSAWGYSDTHAQSILQRFLPLKGAWDRFSTQTLFQFDAAHMFTSSVHEILFDTLESCLQEKGLKPLEELEKRPILHEFYRHPFYRDAGYSQSYPQATSVSNPFVNHAPPTISENTSTNANATINSYSVASPSSPQPLFAMDTGIGDEADQNHLEAESIEVGPFEDGAAS